MSSGLSGDPAAEFLDLVVGQQLRDLVELGLGGGVVGPLLEPLRARLDGPLHAADLDLGVGLRGASASLGLALMPWARIFSASSSWLRIAVVLGQVQVGPDLVGFVLDLLQPAAPRGVSCSSLSRSSLAARGPRPARRPARRPLVERLVQARPLDRGAGRQGVDLAVGVLVVRVELLDPLPAGDRLVPVLVQLVDVGQRGGRSRRRWPGPGPTPEPLGQRADSRAARPPRRLARRGDVPGVVGEGLLADLQRLRILPLRPAPTLARIRIGWFLLPTSSPTFDGSLSNFRRSTPRSAWR